MQEANPSDEIGIRNRERDKVVWFRTQAFAALLVLIVFWTMSVWYFRESRHLADSELPDSLIVNLNDATQAELNLLPGVGEKLANDILKYRDELGGFDSIDQLMNIRGIKQGRLLSLKKHITVSGKQELTK